MCEVRSYNIKVHSNYFMLIIIGSDKEPECVWDIVRMLQLDLIYPNQMMTGQIFRARPWISGEILWSVMH